MSSISGTGMFQFGGLASGLDTKAIIQAMVGLEKRPITLLQNQKALRKTQKSAFSDLDTKLDDLMSSLDKLRKTSNFLEFTATPGEEGYFTASASSEAQQGTWEVAVKRLATTQRNVSASHTSATTEFISANGGGITITPAGSTGTVISLVQGESLTDVASKINQANTEHDTGVTATVIDTGSGFKLQLSAEEPGTDNGFTITTDGSPPAEVTTLVNNLNTNATAAVDSLVAINGVDVTRSTNTITDAIAGVTLNLTKVHSDTGGVYETTNLTIGTDSEEIAKKIKEFVDDYNAIIDFVKTQTAVNEEGEAEGSLVGDFTLGTIRRQLRSIVGGVAATGHDTYTMLAFAGLDADQDGRLTFTESEFEEALADDEQAVKDLFSKDGVGITNRLYDLVDDFTDSVDGLIKNRQDGLDRLMKDLDRQITQAEDRLERYEARLVRQFAGYESLISGYQAQGSALGLSLGGASQ